MDCIFCKIANKEIPAEVIYSDDRIVAFKDINPIAPVHILVIPRKHIASINDVEDEDLDLIAESIRVAKQLAKGMGIANDGYKLLYRVGKNGGQEVEHIHLHLIGGAELMEVIKPIEEK